MNENHLFISQTRKKYKKFFIPCDDIAKQERGFDFFILFRRGCRIKRPTDRGFFQQVFLTAEKKEQKNEKNSSYISSKTMMSLLHFL